MSTHKQPTTTIFDEAPPAIEMPDAPAGADLPAVYRPLPPVQSIAPELQFLAQVSQGQQRDETQMLRRARRVGEMLGERATYDFPAGGGRVQGPTVQLAEALAAEWGHLWWGTRIDLIDGDRVQLTSVVVDALRCTVCTRPGVFTLAPAPGKFRAKPDQTARWEAMQTQVAISKCQRTAILHALPDWYIQAALEGAERRVQRDVLGDRTLPETQQATVQAFGALGVTPEQLDVRMGAAPALWTLADIVELRALYAQIRRGAQTVAGAFRPAPAPAERSKASGLAGVGEAAARRTERAMDASAPPHTLTQVGPPPGPEGEPEPGSRG